MEKIWLSFSPPSIFSCQFKNVLLPIIVAANYLRKKNEDKITEDFLQKHCLRFY